MATPPDPLSYRDRLWMLLGYRDPRDEITYIDCDCESSDHVFRLLVSRMKTEAPTLYLEVQLYQFRGFFKRLVVATRYVLGHQSRFGAWDVTEINHENACKMNEALASFIAEREEWASLEASKSSNP